MRTCEQEKVSLTACVWALRIPRKPQKIIDGMELFAEPAAYWHFKCAFLSRKREYEGVLRVFIFSYLLLLPWTFKNLRDLDNHGKRE